MKNETYNGWTNYATWRINLEYGLNDNIEMYEGMELIGEIAEYIEDYVCESLEMDCNNEMTLGYALSFLDEVNWYEIAEHIVNNLEENN